MRRTTSSSRALVISAALAVAIATPPTAGEALAIGDAVTDSQKGVAGDFDGDGKADPVVVRSAGGVLTWFVLKSSSNYTAFDAVQWGVEGDVPVPEDYDGDGRKDIAAYRPSEGVWYLLRTDGSSAEARWGGEPGDIPVLGDFDGDGKADLGMYRPPNWHFWYSTGRRFSTNFSCGRLVPGDFCGRGHADPATWTGVIWYFWACRVYPWPNSGAPGNWGLPGDIPVAANYDGDERTDVAVFRPTTGEWWIVRSYDGAVTRVLWGEAGDVPQPADYDGDGKADIAFYRPSTGTWWVIRSSDAAVMSLKWGETGDIPVTVPRY